MTNISAWKMYAMVALAALVLAGCQKSTLLVMNGEHNTISAGDIAVSLEAPKRFYNVGEKIKTIVHVQNQTDQLVTIVADSAAPAFVKLSHHTDLGEVELKQYPQFSMPAVKAWTLRAHEVRSFPLVLTVEPDWPRGELLRLTGIINGRPEVQPGIAISINRETIAGLP